MKKKRILKLMLFLVLFFNFTNICFAWECTTDESCADDDPESPSPYLNMCKDPDPTVKDDEISICFCSEITGECVEKIPFSILPLERTDWKGESRSYIEENKIRTLELGNIQIYDVSKYIKHLSNFLIFLAPTIAVAMIVYGSFVYIFSGLTGAKEKGKTIITQALIGFSIVVFSYLIAELVSLASTSAPSLCGNGTIDDDEDCDKMIRGSDNYKGCGDNQICNNSCECIDDPNKVKQEKNIEKKNTEPYKDSWNKQKETITKDEDFYKKSL